MFPYDGGNRTLIANSMREQASTTNNRNNKSCILTASWLNSLYFKLSLYNISRRRTNHQCYRPIAVHRRLKMRSLTLSMDGSSFLRRRSKLFFIRIASESVTTQIIYTLKYKCQKQRTNNPQACIAFPHVYRSYRKLAMTGVRSNCFQ